MLNNRRIVVTGLGVVSSLGIGWKEFWQGLLEGRSGIGPVTSFDTRDHFTHKGGEVTQFRPEEWLSPEHCAQLNRAAQMAIVSAKLGLLDARIERTDLASCVVGVSHGTTFGSVQTIEPINDQLQKNSDVEARMSGQLLTHSVTSALAREFGVQGPVMMLSTACAAGNYAIGYGFDLLRAERAELMIVGASDPFSRIAFTGFNQFKAVAPERCQPFDRNRKGMMVAEGAAALVLEPLERAVGRRAPIYAEILGYGLSCDAHHMTTSTVEGIADCMRSALRQAGVSPAEVDYISAHGTGTPTNDKNECAAIHAVFGDRGRSIPVSSIKSMLGHTMGAASALEAIACALAVKHDRIPPTINFDTPDPECEIDCVPNSARELPVKVALNNSYAFGGNNASLVVRKYIP